VISVIIPTYNRTDLLMNRAIPSLLSQTYQDWECLVVGDGTELATEEAMAGLSARDPRFRFWNLPRFQYPEAWHLRWGLSGLVARNFGLDQARGEFVAALDDDDAMEPQALETLLGEFTPEVDFVYGVSKTYKDGVHTGQNYGRYPVGDGAFCNGAYVYRSSLPYRFDINCFDREMNGDCDMWIRMVVGGVRFHFTTKIVHQYHRNFP